MLTPRPCRWLRLTYLAFPNFPEWRGSCNRTRRDTERKLGRRGAAGDPEPETHQLSDVGVVDFIEVASHQGCSLRA